MRFLPPEEGPPLDTSAPRAASASNKSDLGNESTPGRSAACTRGVREVCPNRPDFEIAFRSGPNSATVCAKPGRPLRGRVVWTSFGELGPNPTKFGPSPATSWPISTIADQLWPRIGQLCPDIDQHSPGINRCRAQDLPNLARNLAGPELAQIDHQWSGVDRLKVDQRLAILTEIGPGTTKFGPISTNLARSRLRLGRRGRRNDNHSGTFIEHRSALIRSATRRKMCNIWRARICSA